MLQCVGGALTLTSRPRKHKAGDGGKVFVKAVVRGCGEVGRGFRGQWTPVAVDGRRLFIGNELGGCQAGLRPERTSRLAIARSNLWLIASEILRGDLMFWECRRSRLSLGLRCGRLSDGLVIAVSQRLA